MSSYGSTSAVVVQPWFASQEFRDVLHAELPPCIQIPDAEPVTARRTAALIEEAERTGLLSHDQATHATLCLSRAQRDEVTAAAAHVLADLGFHVRLASGATSTIWAERGHQVMAMEVHVGGGFEYDLAGLEGPECGTILGQFHAAMAARGIVYDAAVQTHNDPRGGQLIRRVLRHRSPAAAGRSVSRGTARTTT